MLSTLASVLSASNCPRLPGLSAQPMTAVPAVRAAQQVTGVVRGDMARRVGGLLWGAGPGE
jgi:hypothetical protein